MPNCLARQCPVFGRAQLASKRRIREGMLPEFQVCFLLQDTADRIVDARHGHAAIFDQVAQAGDEPLIAQRHHGHIDAGIDGCLDLAIVGTREGGDGFPVADHEAFEVKLALEHVGDEVLVGVHGGAVPARERHHDRTDARFDRRGVAGQMDGAQLLLRTDGVALVLAPRCAAVAEKVLGTSEHPIGLAGLALQALDRSRSHHLGQLGGFAKALVGAAPALVAGHGNTGSEGPRNASRQHLQGGGPSDLLGQLGVARAAHADVVREDGGALHQGIAVDRICAPDDGDAQARTKGSGLNRSDQFDPILGRVGLRQRRSAVEHRSNVQLAHVVGVLGQLPVDLDHLPDLLVERHLAEQLLDVGRRDAGATRCKLSCRLAGLHADATMHREERGKEGAASVESGSDWWVREFHRGTVHRLGRKREGSRGARPWRNVP